MPLYTTVGLLVASTVLAQAPARKPKRNEPSPQTRTFFIEGVRSAADVQAISDSVMKVKSVTKVAGLTPTSGYANISFDHHAVTHQQIAQGIADAGSLKVSFRIVIPDYAAHAEKIDAIFAKVKEQVEITATDKEKGEFVVQFLPLKPGKAGTRSAGFNLGRIGHPIMDAPPKGLGLKMQAVSKLSGVRKAKAK